MSAVRFEGFPLKNNLQTRKTHIRTFGGLTVYHQKRPVVIPWASRKSRLLFSYLIITCNQWVHRDQLCELLCSEGTDRIKASTVNFYINQLRRAFASVMEINPVISQGSAYRLNFEAVTCDCDLFRTHAAQGIKLMAHGKQSDAAQFLANAIDLYGTTFLPEEPDDPFISTARQELADLFAKVRSCLELIPVTEELSSDRRQFVD